VPGITALLVTEERTAVILHYMMLCIYHRVESFILAISVGKCYEGGAEEVVLA
jgi:hypothetical protein